ncbi:MAG: hypothetical protein NTY03_00175 [Candidatus Bathyarchaeota archaeon]|nr:hypothetical protein [Candidatus Bathyarchaeota archaeon]
MRTLTERLRIPRSKPSRALNQTLPRMALLRTSSRKEEWYISKAR